MTRPISRRGTFADTPVVYGCSREHAPLQVWLPARERAEVLVFAGIHGEEPDTTVLLSRVMRSLPAPSAACAVVLCANPDGLRYGTRGNAAGVDLNRNFPSGNWTGDPVTHRWEIDSASEVALSTGHAPASEPEVGALIALIEDLEPTVVVSIHSPLGLIDDPASSALGHTLAERTGLPRTVLPTEDTPGSFGSWAEEAGLTAITYELPNASVLDMLPVHLPVLHDLLQHGLDIGEAPER